MLYLTGSVEDCRMLPPTFIRESIRIWLDGFEAPIFVLSAGYVGSTSYEGASHGLAGDGIARDDVKGRGGFGDMILYYLRGTVEGGIESCRAVGRGF